MEVRTKICGLTRAVDAAAAEAAGARYGGVIFAKGGPRTMDPEHVPELFAGTSLTRCGVFVNEAPEQIAALVTRLDLGVVQLHGDEPPEEVTRIRLETRAEVWKAVRPRTGAEFVAAIELYGSLVDGLLLDGWSQAARGGTGTPFPWSEVARHRDLLAPEVSLIAAGGLSPANVAALIAIMNPDVVDVSSGVERAPGVKDPGAIRHFADAVRRASARQGVG